MRKPHHDRGQVGPDLESDPFIDFSKTPLNFEGFRKLARNPHLAPEEKIGFQLDRRRGHEYAILQDILRKVHPLRSRRRNVVDIGCGAGGLTEGLVSHCEKHRHNMVLVDSEEMLALAPKGERVKAVAGMFPGNLAAVQEATGPAGADAIICYSVMHYIFVDTNVFRFVDAIMSLLAPGGVALIGDIPNSSKRRRFFSSENGVAYHKAFVGRDERPEVRHFVIQDDLIDDAVLAGMTARAQAAGCNAYVLPQPQRLPMSNRRDDFLIEKP